MGGSGTGVRLGRTAFFYTIMFHKLNFVLFPVDCADRGSCEGVDCGREAARCPVTCGLCGSCKCHQVTCLSPLWAPTLYRYDTLSVE